MNTCEKCGKTFEVGTSSGRFCSISCANSRNQKKQITANCITCNKIFSVSPHTARKYQKCPECIAIQTQRKLKPEIPKKNKEIFKKKNKDISNKKNKKCLICGANKCTDLFCVEHNRQQFRSLIKYFGFSPIMLGTVECKSEWNRVRNLLIEDYWINNLTSSDIAKKYNYPSSSNIVGKIFKYLEIPRRNNSEATRLNHMKGTIEPPNRLHFSSQWFDNWDGSKVFLRSSYELEVAQYLNNHRIKYKVEYPRFQYYNPVDNTIHAGLPDFYLPDFNLIIEVKSSYTIHVDIMKLRKKAIENLGYRFMLIYEHEIADINNILQPDITIHNRI